MPVLQMDIAAGPVCVMGLVGGAVYRGTLLDSVSKCFVYFQLNCYSDAVCDAGPAAGPCIGCGVFGKVIVSVYSVDAILLPWTLSESALTEGDIALIGTYVWRLRARRRRMGVVYATQLAWDVCKNRICIIGHGHGGQSGESLWGLDYTGRLRRPSKSVLHDMETLLRLCVRQDSAVVNTALATIADSYKVYGTLWVSQMYDVMRVLGVDVDKDAD